ncbi:enoyl-CoA hydratase/isomerase family protein [Streptomyces sp. NPDC054808]
MPVTLTHADTIAIVNLGDGENTFTPDWIHEVNAALDEALDSPATGLVTTAGARHYSNGLDLSWLTANPGKADSCLQEVEELLARILLLPIPTVAAVNGHAFGAGAMLALAHDVRIMRSDRGYFCFPEIDIPLPFRPGMAALIQAKLPVQTTVESMTTGRRYGGDQALAAGIVQHTETSEQLLGQALRLLSDNGDKHPGTLHSIKAAIFGSVATALTGPDPR